MSPYPGNDDSGLNAKIDARIRELLRDNAPNQEIAARSLLLNKINPGSANGSIAVNGSGTAIWLPPGANGSVLSRDDTQTGLLAWQTYYSTAWTAPTYSSGWSAAGIGAYADAAYSKNRDGVVSVRGLAKKANVVGSTGVIFVLPAGHRPPANLVFASFLSDGVADYPCDLYVLSDGTVQLVEWMTPAATLNVGAATVLTFCSLACIRFDTA